MPRRLGIAFSLALGAVLIVLGTLAFIWIGRSPDDTPQATRPPNDLPDPQERMMFASNYDQRLSRDATSAAPLREDELVIGLVIGGEARAYPVTTLNRREMVNDVVGGTPVLVTW